MTVEPTTAASTAAALTAAAVTVTSVPVDAPQLLGIPADVMLAACAGALFGLAHTKPETWERFMALPEERLARVACIIIRGAALLFTLACNALLAGWGVDILPHIPGFGWTAKIAPQPFAGVMAFAAQYAIPKGIKALEEWRPPWSRKP